MPPETVALPSRSAGAHWRRGAVACAFGAAFAASAASGPRLQWERGALSGATRGQPLNDVLRDVAAATGIVVQGGAELTQAVPANLDRVPLVEALRVLLDGQSFMVLERGAGRTPRVVILGKSGYPAAALAAAGRAAAAGGAGAAPGAQGDDVAARIEAIERLADADDADSFARLREAAAHPHEAVRAVAQEALDARAARSSAAAGRR